MDASSEADAELRTRIRQQEVVADLGQQALESDDLDRVLHDACDVVAETLDTEYATVLEVLPDGATGLLRQGVGWPDGVVGSATVRTDSNSLAGYTLRSAEPVVVDDRRADERFSSPELLTDRDIRSGISVVVGSVDEPWGVLETYATERREFTDRDATFVRNVANVLAAAVDRAETERRLRERERRLERYKEYTDDIFAAVDDIFYVVDQSGAFRRWNDSMRAVTGYSDAEIASMSPLEFIVEEDREAVANGIAEIFDSGSSRVEAKVLTKDGERIPYEFAASRLETPDGAPVLAGIGRDITEREARTRELAEYERIVETINDGIYVADEGGHYRMVNSAYAELTGYSREELRGEHASLVVDESTIERAADVRAEMADDDDVDPTMETTIRTAEGERVPVEVTFASLATDGGAERVGVVRDITERTERQRELARFERAVEASGHAIYMTDVDGEITYVNPAFEETTGYTAEQAVGQTPNILQSGEHDDAYYRTLWETVRAGEVWEEVITDRRTDGELYHAEQTIAPVTDEDGGIDRFVAVQNDITERRERERALEESERRYRTLVEHFPNGAVGLFDEDLRYTAVGGELVDSIDIPQEDRIGNSVSDVYPDAIVEEVEPYFEAALAGEANAFELEYHDRHLFARTVPVRNDDDEVFAGMLVVQDVTERREYQRQLEESNERLEQFAYAASHDLQEPLRMVSSYLQLIERRYADALDEDAEEFIDFAVDGADRMREMIDGLLAYSRVETQGEPIEPVALDDVLDDAIDNLQVTIDERDAEIAAESLPRVQGDASQLQQVFQNLLANAVEYAGDEPPRVHVSAEREGTMVRVSVRDEGIGIDPDEQERIFEVFQRLHSRDEHAGTGIGLALCERIVERHDGTITVDSAPGEGATFSFTLPAVADHPTGS